jgi:hypothetical protein
MAKTIIIRKSAASPDIPSQGIGGGNAPSMSFGSWDKVIERHSEDHSIDLLTVEGFRFTHIPVASPLWVTLSAPILGERRPWCGSGRTAPGLDQSVHIWQTLAIVAGVPALGAGVAAVVW